MQNYKEINAQDYVSASRTTINDNIKTLMSNNSGTEFPTSNLFEGMKCYRTDLKKTYTLKDVEQQTWEEDGLAEALADAVTIAITGGATGTPTVFDGSRNISIPVTSLDATKLTGTAPISITGNANTATTANSVAWSRVTGKINATQSAAGLMSAADKKKLDGIAAEANKYSLPTASSTTLGGVKIGSNIDISGGVISVAGMKAATSSAAGETGLVPAPAAGNQGKFLRGDGTWQTPTNTTYSDFVKSGSSAAHGLVPKPSTTAGTTHYLREDGTWTVPPNTTYSNFVKSGSGAKAGLVPAPSTTAGTTKYLREDGTWQVPPDNNTTYSDFVKSGSSAAHGLVPKPSTTAGTTKYLREDGTWVVPPNTTYSTGTASASGITKLYTGLGDNTDGSMTQKAIKAIVGTGGGITAASLAANGYVKFANGLIVQWGNINTNATNPSTVTFPISFASVCYAVVDSTLLDDGDQTYGNGIYSVTKSNFKVYRWAVGKGSYWFAVGK